MLQWLRIKKVMPHIRGRLLDIGCGNNKLVKMYGNGVGIEDYGHLPIDEFDTVTFVASLNYIDELDIDSYLDWLSGHDDTTVIVTCRKILGGLSKKQIEELFYIYGYHLTLYRPFMFGLNGLYIFKRRI